MTVVPFLTGKQVFAGPPPFPKGKDLEGFIFTGLRFPLNDKRPPVGRVPPFMPVGAMLRDDDLMDIYFALDGSVAIVSSKRGLLTSSFLAAIRGDDDEWKAAASAVRSGVTINQVYRRE